MQRVVAQVPLLPSVPNMFLSTHSVRLAFRFTLVFGVFLALIGCGSSARISDENTRLRRENYDLLQKVTQLEESAKRRDAQFAALEQKLNAHPAVEGVRVSDLPVVSKIGFGAHSGVFDSNGDGTIDTARVYRHTLEHRGRFLPAAGTAVMLVVQIDATTGVKEIARREFNAKAFEAAYVSGITGTHFTLEAEIKPALPKGTKDVTIKVTFTDGATGASFAEQMGTAGR